MSPSRRTVIGAVLGLALATQGCTAPLDSGAIGTSAAGESTPTGLVTTGVVASTWSPGIGLASVDADRITELAAPTIPPLIARTGWSPTGQILLVTWGSSSCPTLPTQVLVTSPTTLRITVRRVMPPERPGEAICTGDLAPTTSVLAPPQGIDVQRPITVEVGAGVALSLPPRG